MWRCRDGLRLRLRRLVLLGCSRLRRRWCVGKIGSGRRKRSLDDAGRGGGTLRRRRGWTLGILARSARRDLSRGAVGVLARIVALFGQELAQQGEVLARLRVTLEAALHCHPLTLLHTGRVRQQKRHRGAVEQGAEHLTSLALTFGLRALLRFHLRGRHWRAGRATRGTRRVLPRGLRWHLLLGQRLELALWRLVRLVLWWWRLVVRHWLLLRSVRRGMRLAQRRGLLRDLGHRRRRLPRNDRRRDGRVALVRREAAMRCRALWCPRRPSRSGYG